MDGFFGIVRAIAGIGFLGMLGGDRDVGGVGLCDRDDAGLCGGG